MKLLTLALMVKNEEDRAIRTIKSAEKYVDHIVIQDTGSTDATIQMIKDYCQKKKLSLKLTEEPWIDFSINRNKLIKSCYGLSQYIMMLDANAELQNGERVRSFLCRMVNSNFVVFGCKHQVDNDFQIEGRQAIFYKPAIFRNNFDGVFYTWPVHEYLTTDKNATYEANNFLETTEFTIYQDKIKDKPSDARFKWDLEKLEEYLSKNPGNLRAMHYIISTIYNMKDFKRGFERAQELISHVENRISDKYDNEIYMFYLCMARCNYNGDMDDFNKYYLKAFKYISKFYPYIEPLFELAKKFNNRGKPEMAYPYIKKACDYEKPEEYIPGITIDYSMYDKKRWELLFYISDKLGKTEDYDKASMKLFGKIGLKSLSSGGTVEERAAQTRETFMKLNPAVQKKIMSYFDPNLVKSGNK